MDEDDNGKLRLDRVKLLCLLCQHSFVNFLQKFAKIEVAYIVMGQIQDLKKEGAEGVRWLFPKIFFANLGDF